MCVRLTAKPFCFGLKRGPRKKIPLELLGIVKDAFVFPVCSCRFVIVLVTAVLEEREVIDMAISNCCYCLEPLSIPIGNSLLKTLL